jgi:hypothetical protein
MTKRKRTSKSFYDACYYGDSATVLRMLKSKRAFPNHRSYDYSSPSLPLACKHVDVMRILLDYGANLEGKDGLGKTVLHNVCDDAESRLESVRFLLDHGSNVNSATSLVRSRGRLWRETALFDATPLHYAVVHANSLDVVGLLLDRGANIHSKDSAGRTALFWACKIEKQIEIVELLLERGANVNEPTNNDETPLLAAFKFTQWDYERRTYNEDRRSNMIDLLLKNAAYVPSLPMHCRCTEVFASKVALNWYYHHQSSIDIGLNGENISWVISVINKELHARFLAVPTYYIHDFDIKMESQTAIPASVVFDILQQNIATILFLDNHNSPSFLFQALNNVSRWVQQWLSL